MRKRRSPNDDAKVARAAYCYAMKFCGRLPKCVRKVREARGLSRYALALASGVSREMIRRIETGDSFPSLFVATRMAWAMGLSFAEFAMRLDGVRRR